MNKIHVGFRTEAGTDIFDLAGVKSVIVVCVCYKTNFLPFDIVIMARLQVRRLLLISNTDCYTVASLANADALWETEFTTFES